MKFHFHLKHYKKFVIVLADLKSENAYGTFADWSDNSFPQKLQELMGGDAKLTGGTISLDPKAIAKSDEVIPPSVLGHELKHAAMALDDYQRYINNLAGKDWSSEFQNKSDQYHESRGAVPAQKTIEYQLKQIGLNHNYGLRTNTK